MGLEGMRGGGGMGEEFRKLPVYSQSQNNVEFQIRRGLARRQDKWLMGF